MYWYYEISHLGYKYNMNNIAASLGIAQLRKLDYINSSRDSAINRFLEVLSRCKYIHPLLPYSILNSELSSYWLFGVRTDFRQELMAFWAKKILAMVCISPLNEQPVFVQLNQMKHLALHRSHTYSLFPYTQSFQTKILYLYSLLYL